jgi:hypothetical protein
MPLYLGAPLLLLLFAASAFPWLLVFRQRLGHLLAVPATAGGALLLLLIVLSISHLLDVNYIVALVVASIVAGALGAVAALRTPNVLRRPGRYAVALWCPALSGAIVWLGTVLAAQFVPGMSKFGWAMNGDALNNLFFADVIVKSNGIALDQSTYSVPLSTALIATGLGAGTPSSSSASAVLEHHLEAFTLVWVIMLAVVCVAVGVVCASLIPAESTRLVATVSALGSLLPLTWFYSGLIIQWGYFNIDVVLPVALAAWLVYLGSRRHPLAALICLVGLAILALAAWTPVAVLVAALGVALVIRHWREILALPRRLLLPVGIGILIGAVFLFSFVNFASVFSLNGELSATGAGFTGFVNLWSLVPIVAALVILTALAVRTRTSMPTTSGVISLVIGAALIETLLVYLASGDGELFNAYYPKKFAWILLAILGVILVSFLVGTFAGRVRSSLIAVVMIATLFVATITPAGTWPEVVQRQPVVRIAGDFVRHDGEATVNEILKLTSSTHATVLWQSGDPDEPIINEWLLLSHGGLANGNPKLIALVGTPYFLYRASGRYEDSGIATLCRILSLLPGHAVVLTASSAVSGQLRSRCPDLHATVVVTTSLKGPIPATTGENWLNDGIEGPYVN